MQPFLKWAGGKRWLVSSEQLPVPNCYNRYIEPFLGGGAVFFHLCPSKAILADLNHDLIEAYRVVRDNPRRLRAKLAKHHTCHNDLYYYKMRKSLPTSSVGRAARTLYLNRTCWNGLYRVNLKGQFNVPIGTKTKVIDENEDFDALSDILSNADIRCCDFSETIAEAETGDFLFVDPPYTVQHNYNGFLKYNEKIFSWADQLRLASTLSEAAKRGVQIVVTNADHQSVKSIYKADFDYRALNRASVLAGDAGRRGGITEAIFTANIG